MIARVINAVRGRLWPRYWYAVKRTQSQAWLVDTCAGGTYDLEFGSAVWYDEPDEAKLALIAAELDPREHTLVRLHTQPQTNHYSMKELPWPAP